MKLRRAVEWEHSTTVSLQCCQRRRGQASRHTSVFPHKYLWSRLKVVTAWEYRSKHIWVRTLFHRNAISKECAHSCSAITWWEYVGPAWQSSPKKDPASGTYCTTCRTRPRPWSRRGCPGTRQSLPHSVDRQNKRVVVTKAARAALHKNIKSNNVPAYLRTWWPL